jgi:uncharacterized protein (TIRG00374 family)
MTASTLTASTDSRWSRLIAGRRSWILALSLTYLLAAGAALHWADESTWQLLKSLPVSVMAAMLGLSLVNYAIRGWRWVYLSELLRLDVPRGANALYYFAGYALTATPGKAGEAVRLYLLRAGHAIGYARSLPLMLADRILDVWGVLLLTVWGLAGFARYRWQGLLLTLLVVLCSLPFLYAGRFEGLARLGARWLGVRRAVRARQMLRLLQSLASWRGYGVALLPSVLGWLAEGAALYLLLRHLDADVNLSQAVFVFAFGMIVGAISMLPGGLGSTEVSMVALLVALGVDPEVALVATAIVRVTTFWFAVAIGALLMPLATRRAGVTGLRSA